MKKERSRTASEDDRRLAEQTLLLYETLADGGGIERLLDTAVSVLQNPVLIADSSFKLIAHAEPSAFPDELWRRIVEKGHYPIEFTYDLLRDERLYEEVYDESMPVMHGSDAGLKKYLSKKIVVNGKPIGFSTCLENDRELTPFDIRYFEAFCRAVGVELRSHEDVRQYHRQRYQYFLSELLSGTLRADFIRERMKQVNLTLKPNLRVIVCEFRGVQFRREHQMDFFRSSFEEKAPGSLWIVYRNSLVGLVGRDEKAELSEGTLHSVRAHLERFDMVGAVSPRFRDISEIGVRHRQAMETIRIAERLGLSERLYDCGQMTGYRILRILEEKEDLRDFCHPDVWDILDYDAANGTDYALTIYAYLSSGLDPVLTSKRLHVHRNTVDYRIRRLSELFGVDANDYETTSWLDVSLRILRLLAVPPFDRPPDFLS
jgi:sugar diacid utilization regulator